ncbi:MAG TPA: DUF929 family protein [Gammaproteobacteria bacterium]|nr:DUF929 family protein [Gammaproteobacteria bacterium]
MKTKRGLLVAAALLVAAGCGVAAYAGWSGTSGSGAGEDSSPPASRVDKPVPKSLLHKLRKASEAGLDYAQAPQSNHFKLISGPRVTSGSKVGVFYLGADFCPYCAGQRWPLLLTLMRFGHFRGIRYMLSSSDDVYPDTVTFTFYKSHYRSDYIDFIPVEVRDREGKPLQSPTPQQRKIYSRFDAPPYAQSTGGIPFVYIDGQYVLTRPLLMAADIQHMDWKQVTAELEKRDSALFRKLMPRVNLFTAVLCRMDGGKPDKVCSAPGVAAANGKLATMQMTGE